MLVVVGRASLARPLELTIVITTVAEAWAALFGFFAAVDGADNPVHAWAAFLVAVASADVLVGLGLLQAPPRTRRGAFGLAVGLGLGIGLAWELYEWLSDVVLGT